MRYYWYTVNEELNQNKQISKVCTWIEPKSGIGFGTFLPVSEHPEARSCQLGCDSCGARSQSNWPFSSRRSPCCGPEASYSCQKHCCILLFLMYWQYEEAFNWQKICSQIRIFIYQMLVSYISIHAAPQQAPHTKGQHKQTQANKNTVEKSHRLISVQSFRVSSDYSVYPTICFLCSLQRGQKKHLPCWAAKKRCKTWLTKILVLWFSRFLRCRML